MSSNDVAPRRPPSKESNLLAARIALANRACNTVRVHTPAQSAWNVQTGDFALADYRGSSGLQDIAAETRKRVNASTLSLHFDSPRSPPNKRHATIPINPPPPPSLFHVHPRVAGDRKRARSSVSFRLARLERPPIDHPWRMRGTCVIVASTYCRREGGSLGCNCLFFHSVFERSSTVFSLSSSFFLGSWSELLGLCTLITFRRESELAPFD